MISVSNIDLIGSGEILYFVIISIIWLSFDMDMVHLRDQSLKPDISPLSPNGVRCASIRSWTSSSGAMVCATCPAACACASRASATRRRRFGVQNSCEPLELYSNYQVKVRITRLLPSWFEWVWVNQKARNWDPWLRMKMARRRHLADQSDSEWTDEDPKVWHTNAETGNATSVALLYAFLPFNGLHGYIVSVLHRSMFQVIYKRKLRRWDQIDISQEASTNPRLQGCSPLCSMCQSKASRVCRPRTWGLVGLVAHPIQRNDPHAM